MSNNKSLKGLLNNKIYKGRVVINEYDFYSFGNVKILYPDEKAKKAISDMIFNQIKFDKEVDDKDKNNVQIKAEIKDVSTYKVVKELVPLLTNLDTSDVTEKDIKKLIENDNPSLKTILEEINNIIERITKTFIEDKAQKLIDKDKE